MNKIEWRTIKRWDIRGEMVTEITSATHDYRAHVWKRENHLASVHIYFQNSAHSKTGFCGLESAKAWAEKIINMKEQLK